MYRTATKRLLVGVNCNSRPRLPYIRYFSTNVDPQSFTHQNPNQYQKPQSETPNYSDSTTSSSSSGTWSKSSSAEESRHHHDHQRYRVEYEDEQARVLQASLAHVIRLGWTEAAMLAGSKDAGVSPSIIGTFPRKEAALVEFFMDECLQKLIDRIDSGEDLKTSVPSELISRLVRIRLEMQAPYISKWPQALTIQAQPMNVPTSFKQRAMLVDEIWHAVDDEASDIDWYVKRSVLGGIYSTAEIYMLTDISPDFRNTWVFLNDRIKDAFDLKKTIQEAKYLAEAVGAGMGNSLQGFVRKVFQG